MQQIDMSCIIISKANGWKIQVSNHEEISGYRLNQIQNMEIKCWAKKGQDYDITGIYDVMLGHLFFEPVSVDFNNRILVFLVGDEW